MNWVCFTGWFIFGLYVSHGNVWCAADFDSIKIVLKFSILMVIIISDVQAYLYRSNIFDFINQINVAKN